MRTAACCISPAVSQGGLLPAPMGGPMMQPGFGGMAAPAFAPQMDPAGAGSPVVLASRLNEEVRAVLTVERQGAHAS